VDSLLDLSECSANQYLVGLPKCGSCGLYRHCRSPKMPVTGQGRKGILVVAEAPGEEEDRNNEQLIGRAGQHLRSTLRMCGVELDRDCWKTNAVICRPTKNGDNRTPTDKEIEYCQPNLLATIRDLRPCAVILLGGVAVRSLIGWLWPDAHFDISMWAGWRIPSQRLGAWICPTYHASYVIRRDREPTGRVLQLWFLQHLQKAVEERERPSRVDYASLCKIMLVPEQAAMEVRRMTAAAGRLAFDYETTTLKPECGEIVSCAVSDGRQSVAFPWHGEAIQAVKEMLVSPVEKVASNLKFEERWSQKAFGHGAVNWRFDTMQDAHLLDNRGGVTSIKFQAFVRLGVDPWDAGIKGFLEGVGGNGVNRIRQLDPQRLLRYNAMDALMEILVANQQAADFGAAHGLE